MHTALLNKTVDMVRQRAAEGDCPVTPAYSIEHLEDALITLADDGAHKWALEQVRETLSRLQYATDAAAFAESQARGLEIIDRALSRRWGTVEGTPGRDRPHPATV